VKYADGPTAEVDLRIEAAPARVWPVVCDINLPSRFSDEFLGGEWLDDASGPALGARFVGRNRHPAIGTWETTSFVVEYEPERTFGWAVTDPESPSASWRFTLAPEDGGTRLRMWVRLGPARSGLSIAIDAMPHKEERIVARRLDEHRRNMTATLEGIRDLVERG
jgi:hypothetical protein